MAHFIRRTPLLFLALPVALVLMLVAVACGGDDATPTSAPTPTTAAATPTTAPGGGAPPTQAPLPTPTDVSAGTGRLFTNTPTPVPGAEPTATSVAPPVDDFPVGERRTVGGIVEISYGEPVYGGRLQVQALSTAVTWDPYIWSTAAAPQTSPMTNSLLQFNPWTFDRYDIWGDLAESWRQVDVDGLVWEFKLKPHATWWDGFSVTAEDVVFSFERMNSDPKYAEANLYVRPNYDFGEVVDERTVRIHLLNKWADFLGYMADDIILMLPKGHYEALDARAVDDDTVFDGDKFGDFMGSGPFIPTYVSTPDEYGYDANPIYWKLDPEGLRLPYLAGMDYFRIVDRTAAQAAWEGGQLWSTNYQTNGNMSPGQMKEMIDRFGDKFVAYPSACCPAGIAMKVTEPPYDDWRVRRALMLAIDRQAFNELVWSGLGLYGTWCGPPGHPLCLTEDEVLQLPGWRLPKDQDYATARQLLSDAGYADGFATTHLTSNDLAAQDEGPVLIENLRNIGIEVVHTAVDRVSLNEAKTNGDYDLVSSGSGSGVITPNQYLNQFFLLPGRNNPFDWEYCGPCQGEEDVDLKALIREQSQTIDPVERRAILRVIDDITLTKDTQIIQTYTKTYARLFNTEKVGGQMPTQSGYVETKAEQLWLLNP